MAVIVARKYELLRALGSGGLGAVFEARHLALGRHVAIKHLHRRYRDEAELCARFLREAQAAAAVMHPGIVAVLDVDEDDELGPIVVLELLVGDPLDAVLAHGPIDWDRAARLMAQALDAVDAAHAQGIVHRDLKPGNLFVIRDGEHERLKVVDFGIARVDARPALTVTGDFVGTPRYASPEQFSDASHADARSDVYSLGVTLLEMVAGPQPARAEDAAAWARERAALVAHGVPDALCAIIARACEPDRAARFQTAAQMRDALRAVLAAEGRALDPPLPAVTPAAARALAPPAPPAPTRVERASVTRVETTPENTFEAASTVVAAPGARRVRRPSAARFVVPVALAALAALGVGLRAIEHRPARARPPAYAADPPRAIEPRARSSRDVLRVGIEALTSLTSPYVANATSWTLAPDASDAPAQPEGSSLYLARVPTLDHDSAQAADGVGFEVTWRLRHDLRWSDGHALTADDVVLGYRLRADPRVVDAHALDAYTALVRWNDRVTGALESVRPVPAHALGAVFAQHGLAAARAALRTTVLPANGPYHVVEFVPGVRTVLEANAHFPGAPPAIRRIEFTVDADEAQLVQRFEAGALDMLASNTVSVAAATALRARRPDAVHIRPMRVNVVVLLDRTNPLLGQLAVRQALLEAIDREGMIADLHDAHARLMDAPSHVVPAGVRHYRFDPAAAATALRDAGALATTLPFYYAQGNHGDERVAERVRDDLQRVGLQVELRPTADIAALRAAGHYGGLILTSFPEADAPIVWWGLPFAHGGVDRAARDSAYDDDVAARIADIERAFVPERRAQIRDDLLVAYSEHLPTLPLLFPSERVVVAPALRGWDQSAEPALSFGIEQWYFVPDAQPSR